ncbi:MAG: hypothetical protein IKU81_05695 [Oscillibacter sp.]|nr:hypothetical protein [Oscillibacter sp.]
MFLLAKSEGNDNQLRENARFSKPMSGEIEVKNMDYHDQVMVDWRDDVLGKAETFCRANILDTTPPKFRFWIWYVVLGGGTIFALFVSFLLVEQHSWVSNMFGNVAAGLIASFVLLLFTNAKEKNLSYYDHMTPELTRVVHSLEIAFNKLYWEERELKKDKRRFVEDNSKLPILENYRIFSMKVYLTHKVLLGLYRQVLDADRLDYKPLHCDLKILDEHERKIEGFEKMIALDYSQKVVGKFDDYDKMYLSLWQQEMELMGRLSAYVTEMQKNIYFVRFGRKRQNAL